MVGTDDDHARWIRRLPLVERLNLERRDEEMARYHVPKTGGRCSCCGKRLTVEETDPLKRCGSCVRHHRRPERMGTGPGRRKD